MNTFILAAVFDGAMILAASLISVLINYEGGPSPKDPQKRKIWFWILAIVNPVLFYSMGAFVLAPANRRALEEWMDSLPLATGVGIVFYLGLGFILSKIFKNGKLGNWF